MEGLFMRVDVNTDTGEAFGRWKICDDESLLPYVSSANVACGAHAGDPLVMESITAACARHGVGIGAHPGFPDLQGFGRREMRMSPGEIEAFIMYQVGALRVFAEHYGKTLTHVKPHGALYNMASVDEAIAKAVARGVARSTRKGETLVLVGLANSLMVDAAKKAGIPVASEGFCDRGYTSDGNLAKRGAPGALISDVREVAKQAVEMVTEGKVTALDGTRVSLKVDTICIHSDTPGALQIAACVNSALKEAGVEITGIREVVGIG
jgi:UPF0271 protein